MLTRRKFIQKLGVLFTLLPLFSMATTKREGFQLCTLKVAGLQYGDAAECHFTVAQALQLKRESDNVYDKYAVAIYVEEKRVGYIPKENARILAALLDNGVKLDAEVRYFDKKKPIWDRLWVGVWQVS